MPESKLELDELSEKYESLRPRVAELGGFFDVDTKRAELDKVEQLIVAPDFWNNQEQAQRVMRRRSQLESAINKASHLQSSLDDIGVMLEFAHEDESMAGELRSTISRLEREVDESETTMLLPGERDSHNAIVQITPGAGGTDAQDWAQMLLRMYLRWCERHGFKTEVLEVQDGPEAGIKSATFRVEGEYAYGLLSAESGVHRLVRISPFNSGASRETSFASVFVIPEIDEDITVEINDKDLRVDTFRSTGAGGQHINTTDSAVRITHLPTGIVVTCQNQRSQHQNREVAFQVLRSRLYEYELNKRKADQEKLESTKMDISFGSQIRNYVMHPYRLVKDTRTKHETGDIDSVLDGEIDEFIKDYLVWRRDNQPTTESLN
ncbi:MAG TPA: peptide chain release factor 2 [Blastocatellia bacterium]|nr:peptide chain release factor 2 [Blastocatellia bacterium]